MTYARYLLLTSILLLSGCGAFQWLPSREMQRVIPADYDATFSAVVEHLQDVGYPIQSTHFETGMVSTECWSDPGPTAMEAGIATGKLIVLLHRKDESHTQVKLYFVKYDGRGRRGFFEAAVVTERARPLYEGTLDSIEARATGHEALHG